MTKLAIVFALCNGINMGRNPAGEIARTRNAIKCLSGNSSIKVLNSGFDSHVLPEYDVIDVPYLPFKVRHNCTHCKQLWVDNNKVQKRIDGGCTTTKFHAWSLNEFDAIAVVDNDVCLDDPNRVWQALDGFSKSHRMFAARAEKAKRRYWGFNTRIMFLKPNVHIFKLLADKAASGDFVPYTNTEQDVLETVFSPRLHSVTMPPHQHNKICKCAEQNPDVLKKKF
jgi:hypothetical protein